jgi:allophanate hydrolase subunit 2
MQIDRIAIVPGNEWELLTKESRQKIFKDFFVIGSLADRMGYRLQGTLGREAKLRVGFFHRKFWHNTITAERRIDHPDG